jgi:hypothetical protein
MLRWSGWCLFMLSLFKLLPGYHPLVSISLFPSGHSRPRDAANYAILSHFRKLSMSVSCLDYPAARDYRPVTSSSCGAWSHAPHMSLYPFQASIREPGSDPTKSSLIACKHYRGRSAWSQCCMYPGVLLAWIYFVMQTS